MANETVDALRVVEDLTDRRRQLFILLTRWSQLRGGRRNSGLDGRPQRTLLISA